MTQSYRALVVVAGMLWLACASSACTVRHQRDPQLASPQTAEVQQKMLLERGLAFSRSGDWERAEEYLSAALDAGASADDALPPLLQSCIAARRYRTAAEHAQDSLPALRRKRPEVELVLAALYLSLDEPERALHLLSEVVVAEPSNATAQYLLAETLRERFQDMDKADPHFRRYLELEPEGRYSELARGNLLSYVAPAADTGSDDAQQAAPVRLPASAAASVAPSDGSLPETSSP